MALIRYTADCLESAEGRWPAEDHTQPPRKDRPVSIRVFQSPLLEFISRAHPITPIIWFGPVIVWSWIDGVQGRGALRTLGLFLGGVLFFTLFEYLLHRVVFHGFIRAAHDVPSRFRAFMAHGYHHEFPNDKMRLVMPPMISWPLAVVFTAAYWLILGKANFFPVLTGTMTGYIAYDWVHYYTHHFHPRGGVGKWMRVYHLRHHHQDPNAHYGVSSPLWDVVLSTYRSPLEKKRGADLSDPQQTGA